VVGLIALAASPCMAAATSRHGTSRSSAATLLGSSNLSSPASFRTRPAVLSLSGDGTAFAGGHGWKVEGHRVVSFGAIRWTSFGGPRASGEGLLWLNDCTPSCADGTFKHCPAKILARAVRKGHYTRLRIAFTADRKTSTETYELLTAGSNSYWQVHLAAAATLGAARSARQPGFAAAILITTYRLTPKAQRTVRFTGYATYGFSTRPKRRIVSATARIVGAQAHAVKIGATSISRNRKRFTVKLVFPGEQGNPGKLVVRLGTVGA
jgi:hypothetical protein